MMAAFGTGEGEGMSSYADIKINGQLLIEWQNTYDEWYFDKVDRKREMATADEERDFIGYRTTVSTIRRRLQLAGYDHTSLERDFNDTRDRWLSEMKESFEYFAQTSVIHKEKFDIEMANVIPKKIEVLRNSTMNDWIKKFPLALSRSSWEFEDHDYDRVDVDIPDDPLLSFMLSPLHGVFNDLDHGFAGALFPCMQMESYAILLLDMSNDDDLCELEITDIVNGGWVNDFDDIEQVQAGETSFYRNFEEAIKEIECIEQDKSTPVLQRMIFSSVITAMETYLSDTMKRHVLNRPAIKRQFVKYYKPFSKIELTANEIFKHLDGLDSKISYYLDKQISFHDTFHIKNLYENVLACKIDDEKIKNIKSYSLIRHDIIHRNGYNKYGDRVIVNELTICKLVDDVRGFIKDIDKQILDGLLDTGEQVNQQ